MGIRVSPFRDAAATAAVTWSEHLPPFGAVVGNPVAPADAAIHARINHGRWIVDCPDCGNAQFAARDDHRFMCCNCANAAVGNLWRPVVWPKDRQQITDIIAKRASVLTQNYEPGETVAELREQNAILAEERQ